MASGHKGHMPRFFAIFPPRWIPRKVGQIGAGQPIGEPSSISSSRCQLSGFELWQKDGEWMSAKMNRTTPKVRPMEESCYVLLGCCYSCFGFRCLMCLIWSSKLSERLKICTSFWVSEYRRHRLLEDLARRQKLHFQRPCILED